MYKLTKLSVLLYTSRYNVHYCKKSKTNCKRGKFII